VYNVLEYSVVLVKVSNLPIKQLACGVRYSILDKDTYNFNKSSFIIGVILIGAVIIGSKYYR
jgi:hypothetical protein